jgi:hypothetical protein
MMHGMSASLLEGHKAHIALAETKIAEIAPEVAKAADAKEAAKERLEKIKRGESVAGGFGKPMDYRQFVAILKAAGWTPRDFRRMKLMGKLTRAEFETFDNEYVAEAASEASDKAIDREARRIIRARQ